MSSIKMTAEITMGPTERCLLFDDGIEALQEWAKNKWFPWVDYVQIPSHSYDQHESSRMGDMGRSYISGAGTYTVHVYSDQWM